MSHELKEVDSVAGISIYSVKGDPEALLFCAAMTIDADGAPNCYGPNNCGIDYTANGGDDKGGNWWGGPTNADGWPLSQKVYDPYPGYYVSATAHFNPVYGEESPYRYLDSGSIPFFVLPRDHANGMRLGDCGLVYNSETGDNCYAIYGDVGPSNKLGEGSIRLAQALNINCDPKIGGTDDRCIAYLMFPGSIGKWIPPAEWFEKADSLTRDWGGLSQLRKLLRHL